MKVCLPGHYFHTQPEALLEFGDYVELRVLARVSKLEKTPTFNVEDAWTVQATLAIDVAEVVTTAACQVLRPPTGV